MLFKKIFGIFLVFHRGPKGVKCIIYNISVPSLELVYNPEHQLGNAKVLFPYHDKVVLTVGYFNFFFNRDKKTLFKLTQRLELPPKPAPIGDSDSIYKELFINNPDKVLSPTCFNQYCNTVCNNIISLSDAFKQFL